MIEPVGENENPMLRDSLQFFANLPHQDAFQGYVPVLTYAMAHFLVTKLDGEVIEPTEMR